MYTSPTVVLPRWYWNVSFIQFALVLIRSDNDKLKMQLKKKDDDLMNARGAIERFTNAVSGFSQFRIEVDIMSTKRNVT